MKRLLILSICICCFSAVADSNQLYAANSEIPLAIRAMAPNQHPTEARFKKIPGSEIDVLVKCSDFRFGQHIGCFKSHLAFTAWNGGAWNWVDWEMVQPAGGGHADYGGNEVYVAELEIVDGTLTVNWSRPIDPQSLRDTDCGAPLSGPVSSHTYASPVFVEAQGEYFHHTTVGWPLITACMQRGQDRSPGQGGWVTDKQTWRKVNTERMIYGRACYHRNRNMIYMRQQSGGADYYEINPANNYSVTRFNESRWLSGAGEFDAAMDQFRDICYWYERNNYIRGVHYDPDTGAKKDVFQSADKALTVPSLSIEHSTGDLIIVGKGGLVNHIDHSTGVLQDISATAGDVIPRGAYIYGKFDMIEKIPCVGIGLGDARDGVYLMTLPASVCDMSDPVVVVPPPEDPPTDITFLDKCRGEGVVFCDPLSTHGPYGREGAELIVLTNEDGTEGVPEHSWWRNWRGVQQWGDNTASYDAEMDALKLVMTRSRGSSGLFTTNFSKDLNTQFAEGDTFFLQFQVRYNCDYIFADCDPKSPTYKTDRRPIINTSNRFQGAKIAIIGEGDPEENESANACMVIQIVPLSGVGHIFSAFHHCGKYSGLKEGTGKGVGGSKQINYQPNGDYRCLRFPDDENRIFANWEAGGTGPNCAYLLPDQWMTVQMQVTIGEWQSPWSGEKKSNIKFWLAHEGQPQRLVIDVDRYLSPPRTPYRGYGKIWFQMHSTGAVTDSDRPDNVVWYRNLVVSSNFIGD